MKVQKHAELIVHWAFGAEIEHRTTHLDETTCTWKDEWYGNPDECSFADSAVYRVAPECDYTLNLIGKTGGNGALDLYYKCLAGKTITDSLGNDFKLDLRDPFTSFMAVLPTWLQQGKLRKVCKVKTKEITQKLWVGIRNGDTSEQPETLVKFMPTDCVLYDVMGSKMYSYEWHRVKSVIRTVKVPV